MRCNQCCLCGTNPIHIAFRCPPIHSVPELFCLCADSDPVPNLGHTHLFQSRMVHVHKVLAGDVVSSEQVDILWTVDAHQPFADSGFVPRSVSLLSVS